MLSASPFFLSHLRCVTTQLASLGFFLYVVGTELVKLVAVNKTRPRKRVRYENTLFQKKASAGDWWYSIVLTNDPCASWNYRALYNAAPMLFPSNSKWIQYFPTIWFVHPLVLTFSSRPWDYIDAFGVSPTWSRAMGNGKLVGWDHYEKKTRAITESTTYSKTYIASGGLSLYPWGTLL